LKPPAKHIVVLGNSAKERVPQTMAAAIAVLEPLADITAIELNDDAALDTLQADLAFVFGGDGAILHAARRFGDNPIAICGVKLGKLGFLATLTDDHLEADLKAIVAGNYHIVSAMKLACTVERDGEVIHQSHAVNDAVVSRGALSRLISIDLLIDGEKVTTYNADGIIVSTPLGSTAHCLAAGGPILEPAFDAMVLAPICPHTLSNRPLAISAEREVQMCMNKRMAGTALTVDGQVYQNLESGDCVKLTRADTRFNLVRAEGHSYFETLREKLGWGGHVGPGTR
jgi:NAD+ kinase